MKRASGLALLALLASCSPAGDMDMAEKRRRVDEMYASYRTKFPLVQDISVDELIELLESEPVVAGREPPLLVDVRTDAERAVSIIPGAISQQELESRRDELSGRSIITYCTIGYRSGLYADELRRQGFDVRNLKGSVLSWTHTGRPLEHEGEKTRRVHIFGPTWDLAADDFEAVW